MCHIMRVPALDESYANKEAQQATAPLFLNHESMLFTEISIQ